MRDGQVHASVYANSEPRTNFKLKPEVQLLPLGPRWRPEAPKVRFEWLARLAHCLVAASRKSECLLCSFKTGSPRVYN